MIRTKAQSACALRFKPGQAASADAVFVTQVRARAIEPGEQRLCNAGAAMLRFAKSTRLQSKGAPLCSETMSHDRLSAANGPLTGRTLQNFT
jgi:hypothetical protein